MRKLVRKSFKKKFSFFPLIVVSLSIACCIFIANLFSVAITTSSFGFLQNGSKTQNELTVHALSMATASTLAQANEIAADIRTKNGAGYVYKDTAFEILASAYENENDAKKVQQQLTEQGNNSRIIKINIPQTTISSSYSLIETGILDLSLNCYKEIFRALFDLSIALDTQTKTVSTAQQNISALVTKVSNIKKDFKSELNGKLTANLIALSLQNDKIFNILKILEKSTGNIAQEIKISYFEIIFGQKEMINSLSTTIF